MNGSEYSLIQIYKWFVVKEKAIFTELNKLQNREQIFMGLFWCPAKYRDTLEDKIYDIKQRRNIDGPQIHIIQDFNEDLYVRPTFIEQNEFTYPFQEIVNTYAVPQYKEVNPAIFTSVTFPFLFGIMFGDVMHGALLFIFSTILCFSKRTPGTAMGELGKVRYLLLLMGFFSFFCGLMYNDFTSIPLKMFGDSCYDAQNGVKTATYKGNDCIYPVGVDPVWYLSKNELSYMNSLKMKLSVILGVGQMALGVFMKAMNSIYFKRWIDFIFEFIPQIILLLVLFGFMDLMIIVKWLTNYNAMEGAKPPSIITSMITMCLGFGEQNPNVRETELFPY